MAEMRQRAPGFAPFLYDDTVGVDDWRERLHWPVPQVEISAIGRKVPGAIIAFAASLDNHEAKHLTLIVGKMIAGAFMSLLEAALVCDRADRLGLEIGGGPPELPQLSRGGAFQALKSRGPFAVSPVSHAFLRGMARSVSWTPLWRMPQAILAATATAVSHNALLRSAARGRAIAYRHAPNIIAEARRRATSPAGMDVSQLCRRVFDWLILLVPDLRPAYQERMRRAFVARLEGALALIVRDIVGLRRVRLPRRLWCGTVGAYPTRLIAGEVLRRGGAVDAFDHGGATGISQLPGSTALTELCSATRFHVATPQLRDVLARSEAPTLAATINGAEIIGENGEPTFRHAFRDRTEPTGRRKRVIYIGHPYRGLRQFALAGLPDAVYWDFQMHLVGLLQSLDIDLLCKPHPEGHFIGKRSPIEGLAATSYRRFEEHLDDADLFLFDAPTSTTFMEALCTRRPVVLVDRFYAFNPAVIAAIEARCRIVPARPDAQNRLRIDPDALAEAVLGAPREADPAYFRRLVVGDLH